VATGLAREPLFTPAGQVPAAGAARAAPTVARAMKYYRDMTSFAKLPLLLAAAWTLMDAAPALAKPVVVAQEGSVRDRRTQPPPPPPSSGGPRRYRRRPGPRLMAPLKIDIGATGGNTSQGFLPGVELRAGIHWASLSPQPTNFDIGLGVFGAVLAGPKNDAMPDAETDVVYGGAYLEAAQTLSHGDYWRTWAGGRGEYIGSSAFGEDHVGFGVAGRVSAELYLSGVGIEPRGLFLGTYAIGVYAEAGARQLGPDVDALQISAGLTFRTPLVFTP